MATTPENRASCERSPVSPISARSSLFRPPSSRGGVSDIADTDNANTLNEEDLFANNGGVVQLMPLSPPPPPVKEEVKQKVPDVLVHEKKHKVSLPPQRRSFYARVWIDGWLWEFVTLFMSVVLLAVIIVLLIIYDGHKLPDWPQGISLNTVISILGVFAAASVMVPTASGISQMKWLWFAGSDTTRRALGDLQSFDEASRGAVGCIKLIDTAGKSPLAMLGVLITILSFAMNPMLQQTVTYPTRNLVWGTSSVPLARSYAQAGGSSGGDTGINPEYGADQNSTLTMAMQAAVLNGLSDSRTSLSNVSASCSTGSCTFDQYSTLGICAAVADVTSSLNWVQRTGFTDGNWTLPNDHRLFGGFYYLNMTTFTDDSTPVGFPKAVNPLADIYIIYGGATPTGDNAAVEILLQMCIQTYSTTVVDGITTTTLVSTRNESTYSGTLLTLDSPDGQDYLISDYARKPIQRALSSTFTGMAGKGQGATSVTTDAMQAVLSSTGGDFKDLQSFLAPVERAAISMTNSIRRDPGKVSGSTEFVGTAWRDETYIHVTWAWLALPIAVEVLAILFLLSVIQKSKATKIMAWKDSGFAVMRSLSAEIQGILGGLKEHSIMENEAEGFDVALETDGFDWKLKLN